MCFVGLCLFSSVVPFFAEPDDFWFRWHAPLRSLDAAFLIGFVILPVFCFQIDSDTVLLGTQKLTNIPANKNEMDVFREHLGGSIQE